MAGRDGTRRDETRRTDRQTVKTVRARAASQLASLPACLWESFSTCSTPSRPCRASNSTDRSILLLLRAASYPKPSALSLSLSLYFSLASPFSFSFCVPFPFFITPWPLHHLLPYTSGAHLFHYLAIVYNETL